LCKRSIKKELKIIVLKVKSMEDIQQTAESVEFNEIFVNGSDEQLGRKQTTATKKKIAKKMEGKNNPAYKDGRRSYREKVNAKPGQLVHHKDGDSTHNAPSNLEKIPKKERSKHEKEHDREKNFKGSGGRKHVPRGYKAKR
jgi:hypothetical protein